MSKPLVRGAKGTINEFPNGSLLMLDNGRLIISYTDNQSSDLCGLYHDVHNEPELRGYRVDGYYIFTYIADATELVVALEEKLNE